MTIEQDIGGFAGELCLVEGGAMLGCITADPAWGETERFAADELAAYLHRITGARPRADGKGVPIRIGTEPAGPQRTARLDTVRITVAADGIAIRGATPFATLNGVYRFLEMLGCRWYAPDFAFYGQSGGSVVPRHRTICLRYADLTHTPTFALRRKYCEEGRSQSDQTLRQLIDWMPKVGLNTLVHPMDCFHAGFAVWDERRATAVPELRKRGMTIEVGGHGYENFLTPQIMAQHPEWGGMRADGSREPNPVLRSFCTSNADAMRAFQDEVERYWDAHPEIDIFDLWPPDTLAWCECGDCKRLGGIPYRHALVTNAIARLAQRKRPGMKVEIAAYFEPSVPPEGIRFEDNVIVDFCPITRSHEHRIYDASCGVNRFFEDILLSWFDTPSFKGQVGVYTYYRKYAWRSLPILLPQMIADELRYYRVLGVDGIGSYAEPADWWTYELQHYVVARLTHDTATDLDGLLRRYFEDRYGAAGQAVRDMVQLIENFLPRVARVPGTIIQNQTVAPDTAYEFFRPTAELMRGYERKCAQCEILLSRARAAPDLSPEIVDRLDRWTTLLRYVALEVKARAMSLALADRGRGGHLRDYIAVMTEMAALTRANAENGLILHTHWADYGAELT